MKKPKYFSMIELLVGIVVLTIMMAFLINAFTTAERIASTGNKSMTVFEKSNMALDFMAGDIRQLIVNASPRTPLSFTYDNVTAGDSTACSFTAREVFTDTPGITYTVTYRYDQGTGELFRAAKGGSEELVIDNIEFFTLEFYNENGTPLHNIDAAYSSSAYAFNFFPNYCHISIKLQQDSTSGSENVQRSFMRRIYFE